MAENRSKYNFMVDLLIHECKQYKANLLTMLAASYWDKHLFYCLWVFIC
jgi:hypothetical protein